MYLWLIHTKAYKLELDSFFSVGKVFHDALSGGEFKVERLKFIGYRLLKVDSKICVFRAFCESFPKL